MVRLPCSTRLKQHCRQVIAKAYDNPIPGYGTATVGNLRLWESLPVNELNLGLFNEGKFSEVRSCPRPDPPNSAPVQDCPVAAALTAWPCPQSSLSGGWGRPPLKPGAGPAAVPCSLSALLHGCTFIASPSGSRLQPRQPGPQHSAAEQC